MFIHWNSKSSIFAQRRQTRFWRLSTQPHFNGSTSSGCLIRCMDVIVLRQDRSRMAGIDIALNSYRGIECATGRVMVAEPGTPVGIQEPYDEEIVRINVAELIWYATAVCARLISVSSKNSVLSKMPRTWTLAAPRANNNI